MAEVPLITIADVTEYRKIDPKTDQEKFDSFVKEVQRINLRDTLGDKLYYDFFKNITDAKYIALRDGEEYELDGDMVDFFGLKPYLCYCYLAKSAKSGDLYHSVHGAITFTNNPQQNFERAKSKEIEFTSYMEIANEYRNDIINFLDEKNSIYPLWESKKEGNQVNFISFRV